MPKIVDHTARRESILETCFELFAERGYSSITMREIAKVVGVSTGSLYHYFETKEDILHQLFEYISRKDVAEAAAVVSPDMPPEQRVEGLRVFVMRNRKRFQQLLLLALDYYRQYLVTGDERVLETITQAVRYYREAIGEQLKLSGTTLEPILFSFTLGMMAQQALDEEAVDLNEHFDLLRQLLPVLDL